MTVTGVGTAGLVYGANRSLLRGVVYEKWIRGYGGADGPEVVHAVVRDSLETPYVVESSDDLELFETDHLPVVSDDAHARLLERFESVEYGIDVCSDDGPRDCRGGPIDRDGFNAVQVADEATVAQVRDRVRLLDTPG